MGHVVADTLLALVSLLDEGCVYALQSAGALAHATRRRVIAELLERERMQRDELAAVLADDEVVRDDDAERIAITLHHHHLPKLDDDAFVEYDSRTGDVVLWKDPDVAAERLDSA